jgi:hypothetical protein
MGLMRYPAKPVPELDKMLEAVYRQWREYFEGNKSY